MSDVSDFRERWNERYRAETFTRTNLPTPLVVEAASRMHPGDALDLACGTGRNALWLAAHGWNVTAVDGSDVAINVLESDANLRGLPIRVVRADLESGEYNIEAAQWDLIVMSYYLQTDLFQPAFEGLRPGGALVIIVNLAVERETRTHVLRPGELRSFFRGHSIVHYYEGPACDDMHHRSVAEVVVEKRI